MRISKISGEFGGEVLARFAVISGDLFSPQRFLTVTPRSGLQKVFRILGQTP